MAFWPLLYLAFGILVGIFVGGLPGLGPSAGIALVLPFTFAMPPDYAIVYMVAIYVGSQYGNSITAILLAIPGTPSSVPVIWDGHPMAQRGEAGKALGISLISSAFGHLFSTVTLILLAVPFSHLALAFRSSQYFLLGILGLTLIVSLSPGSQLKGLIGCAIGLLIATVGTDIFTGYVRFGFDSPYLINGIGLVPVLLGLFGVSQALMMTRDTAHQAIANRSVSTQLPTWAEFRRLLPALLRSSIIGNLIGILPGAGGSIASIVAYAEERRRSPHPERFGTGVLEGVVAPAAADNAVVGGSLVPTFTFGIPGSPPAAILLGALMVYGLTPGPDLFAQHSAVLYTTFASLPLAGLFLVVMGFALGFRGWARILAVPKAVLAPLIVGLCVVGSYVVGGTFFDIWVTLLAGIAGYFLRLTGFPTAPIVLGLVLGNMIEVNFRRALLVAHGDYSVFFRDPLGLLLTALIVLSLLSPLRALLPKRRATRVLSQDAD